VQFVATTLPQPASAAVVVTEARRPDFSGNTNSIEKLYHLGASNEEAIRRGDREDRTIGQDFYYSREFIKIPGGCEIVGWYALVKLR
jgi:hypothetical protein